MTENSETYRIVRKMIESGNQPGVIQLWKNMVEHWAVRSTSPDAQSVKAWLPAWQARAAYSAAELAPIFPALSIALGVTKFMGRLPRQKSPAMLARELKFARLPWRHIDGKDYFIVERCHYWSNVSQEEFEKEIFGG